MLERIAYRYAMRLRNLGHDHAAVVIAKHKYYAAKDTSGQPPDPIAINLERKLLTIGDIGERVNGNLIGHCAEVRSSNKFLIIDNTIPLNRIIFSPAMRPRTMQEIPMCNNCRITFR